MGMDYNYAGSASYPRFDDELCAVAKVLGGVQTEHLKQRKATENERVLGYWFGFLSSDDSNNKKFYFPQGTNEVIIRWFNNIYETFTPYETKIIWETISKHPQIKEISRQIWYELEKLVEFNEGWEIF